MKQEGTIDIVRNIRNFNRGREPERLAMKYANMRADPFVFLRATCHLFYARLPAIGLPDAPAAWCCGDLHLENFGSYKGSNRLAYFDINDFDEAALAPLNWDLVRFLASVQVGAADIGLGKDEAKLLCASFVDAYAATLGCGKSGWVEHDTAQGLVRELLDSVAQRRRAEHLDRRTVIKGGRRRIRIDGRKALAADAAGREHAAALLAAYARTQPNPGFYAPLDIARRIAGNGSLGVERYIIVVEGKGGTDGNYLLDLKQALPTSLTPQLALVQPKWGSEAQRIVALQYRLQAVSMAFLHALEDGLRSYVLRALLPSEDRVTLDRTASSLDSLASVMRTMGGIAASAHLRGSGRQGSASADELVAYAGKKKWKLALLAAARDCAKQVGRDWSTYCAAFDDGAFR
jgi:uncharacterized protein (DUF2252 family)